MMRHATTEADRRNAKLYGDTVPTLCGSHTDAYELRSADEHCPECNRLLQELQQPSR